MKGGRSFAAGMCLAVALAVSYGMRAAHAWPAIDTVAAATAPAGDAGAIARGAKLAALGDCMTCHTAQGGAPFAGGRPLATPFGVIYSTNITPDKDTGIGGWPLEAFTRAMRYGVSRDGHRLYPAFPYPHFTKMSDADIASLYAWLMTRDAVHARAPANALTFPLGFRPLMAVWDWLYLHPGPEPQAAPNADANADADVDAIARGRYLVTSVGHCGACHTPLKRLGAEDDAHALQGGTLEGWDAPSLVNLAQRPRPWTQAQLASYLRTGFASEHGAAAGPMRPVTELLANASPADVDAIAAYLLSLDSETNPAPLKTAAVSRPALHGNGATLFAAACAACHGETAPLMPNSERPSLALSTAVNAASPRNVVRILLDGIAWQGSAAAHFMPPFAGTFTNAQIADLANYTRARFSTQGAWPALDADAVARYRKEGTP